MATAAALVPLEEYLRTTYHPDRDWVDGELRERNVGEGSHSILQKFFTTYFGVREEEWNILTRPEQRVQTSGTHYRIPDVCLTILDEPFEQIVITPPLLCIEILSPDDRMSEMYTKVDEYVRMGVRTVWVIDPMRRAVFSTQDGQALLPVSGDLIVPGTPIRVGLNELFAQLNRLERKS